jgi:serine/threonine protein phosphatase PrpC/CRP-like cAMP-binding protein
MGCGASTPETSHRREDGKGLLANGSDHQPKNGAVSHGPAKPNHTNKPQPGTAAAAPKSNHPKTGPPNGPSHGMPSTAKPFNRARDRIDAIEATRTVNIDNATIRYAYLSQRGFYPDDPFKANQDAYDVQIPLSNNQGDAFLGIFDGHGKDGDGCAIFAKHNLHKHVHGFVNARKSQTAAELTKEEVHHCITKAHVETNRTLRKNPKVDDSLSGTTAISVYFHGRRNRMTIANVGDSRAVLGQAVTGNLPESAAPATTSRNNLKAVPLSRDQTPYRKDERSRIRATGARVLSLDQLEGLEPIQDISENGEDDDFVLGEELDEGGDPPRVWSPDGDFPGTAFTRSIGDAMAEDLGVYAEPELLTREMTPDDKIIVLASDGVFEFLTNQSVIDICAKFNDPLEACRAVVAEAYELWLQYELRTDDITIICMFVDQVKVDPEQALSGGARNNNASTLANSGAKRLTLPSSDDAVDGAITTMEGLRPVRKHATKEKSKAIEALKRGSEHSVLPDEPFDWKEHATEKTAEEKEGIAEAIKASVMFRNVTEEQREMIFACMESVPVKQGTWVIRQNTVGDRFYIIDEGQFEVRIVPDGDQDESGQGGHIVHVYEGSRARHAHPSFGELALMYSAPRSASIVAKTDGHLWALHRSAFRQVLVQAQDHRKGLKKALSEIPYFQYLDSDEINKLAAIMDEVTFGRGETIAQQGAQGEKMFVISSGQCYSDSVSKRATLKGGAWFGDEIFSGNGIYNATVMSLQTTNLWQLDANVLKQTMGPLLQGGKASV